MTTRLKDFAAATRPIAELWLRDPTGTCLGRAGSRAAWPIAILTVLHGVCILAANGSTTDDFTTVYTAVRRFLDGTEVYNEIYHHVDPHYLYNPGATLLLTPMGLIDDPLLARGLFILVNAAAIIAALGVATTMVGHRLTSPLWPLSIALAFATESVRNTLIFSNINGILLLIFTSFLALWTPGRSRWGAGVLLGIAIVVKPMFAPLLVLPLMRLDVRTIAAAVGVPVLTNLLAWPIVPGASAYVTTVMPYLSETRDYANSSLAGFAEYFAMPRPAYVLMWVILAGLCGVGILALAYWRYSDPTLWAMTTSGLVLAGVFVLSNLGQQYYSMMLFPLMFTVVLRTSAMHVEPAWLGAFLVLAPFDFTSEHWPDLGRWATTFLATAGWALVVVTVATAAVCWVVGNTSQGTSVAAETYQAKPEGKVDRNDRL